MIVSPGQVIILYCTSSEPSSGRLDRLVEGKSSRGRSTCFIEAGARGERASYSTRCRLLCYEYRHSVWLTQYDPPSIIAPSYIHTFLIPCRPKAAEIIYKGQFPPSAFIQYTTGFRIQTRKTHLGALSRIPLSRVCLENYVGGT